MTKECRDGHGSNVLFPEGDVLLGTVSQEHSVVKSGATYAVGQPVVFKGLDVVARHCESQQRTRWAGRLNISYIQRMS